MKSLLITFLLTSLARAATFEPLGQPCRSFNVLASRIVTDPAGKNWFVLSNTNETTGVELIFIDFAKNTGKTCRAPAGQGAWLLDQVAPDRLVVGTYYDGKLMIFDLNKMAFTKVIAFPGEEYFWNGAIGGDKRLYGGTYPGGKLGALNLDTYELEDCGAPAPPNLYCRNVSPMPDGRLLCNFVATKPITKIYDPKTKQWSDVPEQLKNVQKAVVWNGYLLSTGTWDGKEASGPIAFDGEKLAPEEPPPFPIPPGGKLAVDPQLTSTEVLYLRQGSAIYRLPKGQQSLTKVFDQDLSGGAITAVAGDGTLLGVRGQDYLIASPGEKARLLPIPVQPAPRPMMFLRADDAGRLWTGPQFGQTLTWIDLASKKFTNTGIICNAGGEVYDVALAGGKVYAVAYVGGDVVEYDPSQPWDQLSNKNPRTIAHLTTKGYIRPTAGVRVGADGLLYSGWTASYGKYGGAIAVTDPKSGATKLIENPLGEQPITALALDHEAHYLFIGTGLHGNGLPEKPNEKPQFGMIDIASGKVLFQQTIEGAEVAGALYNAKTKQVVLIAEQKLRLFDPAAKSLGPPLNDLPPVTSHPIASLSDGRFVFASGNEVVRYDLTGRKLEKFPAPAKIDHLAIDRSGVVYVSCGPDLYRMTP